MKTLMFWNMQWLVVVLAKQEKFSILKGFFCKNKKNQGWAYRCSGKWFSVYIEDDKLMFRVNKIKIPISNKYKIENEKLKKSVRRFRVFDAEQVVFECNYKSIDFLAKNDPTYDLCDEINDDFFLWLENLWSDEKMQFDLLKLWSN